MIDVTGAIDMLMEFGLNTTKIQKYNILSNKAFTAFKNNKISSLTVRDIDDLCDLLCCKPEDIIKYRYSESAVERSSTLYDNGLL